MEDAVAGKVPVGSKLYHTGRSSYPAQKAVIVTGNQITDASSGFDQRSNQPAVFVSLDGPGARRMRNVTTDNVGKPMAVVFIETRTESRVVDGKSNAQDPGSGGDQCRQHPGAVRPFSDYRPGQSRRSTRSGAVAACRRPGGTNRNRRGAHHRPSLGQDNIDQGFRRYSSVCCW